MARPKAKELTERELEVMHVFWDRGESTAADVREALATQGRDLAYTTVATLVRILLDKEFLTQSPDEFLQTLFAASMARLTMASTIASECDKPGKRIS